MTKYFNNWIVILKSIYIHTIFWNLKKPAWSHSFSSRTSSDPVVLVKRWYFREDWPCRPCVEQVSTVHWDCSLPSPPDWKHSVLLSPSFFFFFFLFTLFFVPSPKKNLSDINKTLYIISENVCDGCLPTLHVALCTSKRILSWLT